MLGGPLPRGRGDASSMLMRLVLLPIKLVLGGVTLAGAAMLGLGLGVVGGACCARLCRTGRHRAASEPGAGVAEGSTSPS
jgi:hypothetical protein